jgi:hypothetical protein
MPGKSPIFESAGKNSSRFAISFLLRDTSVADHGRITHLLGAITTTYEMYRCVWHDKYTDYRPGVELG